MKNKALAITLALVLLCSLAVGGKVRLDNLRLLGQLEKARVDAQAQGNSYIVAQGTSIKIYSADVDMITNAYTLQGSSKGKKDAIEFLGKRGAAAAKATAKGLVVTDQEVTDYITLQKTASLGAVNYSDFQTFLDAAEMTHEEYWDRQFDFLKDELLATKLMELEKANWNKVARNAQLPQEEAFEKFKAHWNSYNEKLLKQQNLVTLAE